MSLTTTTKLNNLAHWLLDRRRFWLANLVWRMTRWSRDRPARKHRRSYHGSGPVPTAWEHKGEDSNG